MKLSTIRLWAGTAIAGLALSSAALAQEPVTLVVWSIDGAQGRPGPTDTFSREFDEMNDDITVEYRALQFDEIVNETMRA